MPISVLCAGCKTRFEVSEKFAGKKGPCPKCKAIITIPEVSIEDIKVHVPEEFASGGKDAKGRLITKPVAKVDAKINPLIVGAVAICSALALAVAFVARGLDSSLQLPIVIVGLAILGPPLAVSGYGFLRNDELEPYSGQSLWLRATICGLAFGLIWGIYAYIHHFGFLSGDLYQWVFAAPVFIALGGVIGLATLDLDYASGAMLYCYYLLVTLLLRFVVGWPAVWTVTGP